MLKDYRSYVIDVMEKESGITHENVLCVWIDGEFYPSAEICLLSGDTIKITEAIDKQMMILSIMDIDSYLIMREKNQGTSAIQEKYKKD